MGIGSASSILETRVGRDEDLASRASTTPTQTVPSANAHIETRKYRFNSHESFNFTKIFDAFPSATDVDPSISSTHAVPSSTNSNTESSTTAAPFLSLGIRMYPSDADHTTFTSGWVGVWSMERVDYVCLRMVNLGLRV